MAKFKWNQKALNALDNLTLPPGTEDEQVASLVRQLKSAGAKPDQREIRKFVHGARDQAGDS